MPADRVPTTPAEWAAITEKRTHSDYELTASWLKSDGAPYNGLDLAAASRIAEHERCVAALAVHLFDGSESMSVAVDDAHRILEAR